MTILWLVVVVLLLAADKVVGEVVGEVEEQQQR
jgi:hypothetical protein